MASHAIRIKRDGTGSVTPLRPAMGKDGNLPTGAVACAKTQHFLQDPSPLQAAEAGLPCFRRTGVYMEIFVPSEEKWYNLITWWNNNHSDHPEGLEEIMTQVEAAFGRGPTPATDYDFVICLPYLAGATILYKDNLPLQIVDPKTPHLHVFRIWGAYYQQQGLTIGAKFENLDFEMEHRNKLSIFIERPSEVGTIWAGFYPDATDSGLTLAQPLASAPGDMTNNLHPWPIYSADNLTSGIVPVWADGLQVGFPTIPLAIDGQSHVTYVASPRTWEAHFYAERQGDYYCVPYAVFENIDPVNAAATAKSVTPYDPLPKPDATSGAYLAGRYKDEDGNISIVNVRMYSIIGGVDFDDFSHETVELDGSVTAGSLAKMPIVPSEADLDGMGRIAWAQFYGADITPDYPSRLLHLCRIFDEYAAPAIGDGPVLAIRISTGTGGTSSSTYNTATVSFRATIDGGIDIIPVNDAPTPTITSEGSVVTFVIPYADLLEKDPYGYYFGGQDIVLRYILSIPNYTRANWTLYPQTVSAVGNVGDLPAHPGEYVGYDS